MDLTPKPIKIDEIQFRSKLEGRWYLFMKRLGWNIIYEPDIKGLNNWIPDFLIIGKNKKILVDVKPIDTVKDWEKHPDRIRIEESGIKDLKKYELLILGTNLQLDGIDRMGLLYTIDPFWPEGRPEEGGVDGFLHPYNMSECTFSNCGTDVEQKIGFMDQLGGWHCRISGELGKTYLLRENRYHGNEEAQFRFIDTCWNEAGTQLQWNTPTSEHYLKGKTHPNSNQYCMDCKTNSVNWWKKKNLFYCTKCKEVKCFYCWEDEAYNSPKHYALHKAWTRGGEAVKFFYATVNSESWGE